MVGTVALHVWLAAALGLILLTLPRGSVAQARHETAPASSPAPSRAPYLTRGDEVEGRYRVHRERLERFSEALGARLAAEAPDLRAKLEPPAPVAHGYRILPKVVPDPRPLAGPPRIITASFSWRGTESLIERDGAQLDRLEARLGDAARSTGEQRRQEYEKLVGDYRTLAAGQMLMASQIQYNRLWQGDIARDPGRYGRPTALHDAVLERQALLDALPVGDHEIEADLRARAEALSRRIEEAIRKGPTPGFVRLEHPSPHRWIVRVPVYTDIEDAAFTDKFRAAVENAWRLRDGDDEFSVAVEIRLLSPGRLYPDGALPPPGAHIDLAQHIGRFPPDGAVLTTGAGSTHVLGLSINLGPHDITPNVLAHEFGHLLGFADGYFRGYRDGGPDGYEVLEVVIDPGDIMSAPGAGRVLRQHFEQLLSAARA